LGGGGPEEKNGRCHDGRTPEHKSHSSHTAPFFRPLNELGSFAETRLTSVKQSGIFLSSENVAGDG
jgi:hypothetical protein